MSRRYRHLIFKERCQVEIPKKSGLSRGSIVQHPELISDLTALSTGTRQGAALQIGTRALIAIKNMWRKRHSYHNKGININTGIALIVFICIICNYSPHIQPSIIPRNFKGHLSGILFHSILITMVLDGRIAH